jgi:hypothetical protein
MVKPAVVIRSTIGRVRCRLERDRVGSARRCRATHLAGHRARTGAGRPAPRGNGTAAPSGSCAGRMHISSSRGRVNGSIDQAKIFGRCTAVVGDPAQTKRSVSVDCGPGSDIDLSALLRPNSLLRRGGRSVLDQSSPFGDLVGKEASPLPVPPAVAVRGRCRASCGAVRSGSRRLRGARPGGRCGFVLTPRDDHHRERRLPRTAGGVAAQEGVR